MQGASATGSVPPPAPPEMPRLSIVLCRACGRPIDPFFAFCPYCGKRQRAGDAWYYNPISILLLALFILGPFALPLVWRSAKMGLTAKLVYTAGILVYTVLTAYWFYEALIYELSVFSEFTQLM